MDRPKSVVWVIRGVADTVNISCLLWAGSSIYGVRYLRAIGSFSMSQCATGPARESTVCPGRAATKRSYSLMYDTSASKVSSSWGFSICVYICSMCIFVRLARTAVR